MIAQNFLSKPSLIVLGAALLLAPVSINQASAMPVNSTVPAVIDAVSQGGLENVYYLHRRYPGYHSRAARSYRRMHRNAPNRFCQKQPSRCR